MNHTPLKRARLPVPPLSHIQTPLFYYSKKVSEEIYRGHAPQTVRFRKLRLLIEVLRTVGLRSAVATRLISHYSNTFILLLEEGLRGVSRDNIGIILQKNRFVNTFLKKI